MIVVKERYLKFLKRAENKFGDRFDYSEAEKKFIKQKLPVPIQCKKHNNQFSITPDSHLQLDTGGCPECSLENIHKKAIERRKERDIIEEFRVVHGDKYDYSLVDLASSIDNKNRIEVICSTHGPFLVDYNAHLSGVGCRKCSRRYVNTEEFIECCKELYGDKYGYDKTEYVNSTTKVTVTCQKHNCDFQVLPLNFTRTDQSHFNCPMCSTQVYNKEDFIKKAEEYYPDLFDFSLVDYVSAKTPVKIVCKKCGLISEVFPDHFFNELFICSCSKSGRSKLETIVGDLLTENGLIFKREHTFSELADTKQLRFDFYIESLNLIIECQGEQHFSPLEFFGGKEKFEYLRKHDQMKREYCREHEIRLVYFMYKFSFNNHFNDGQSEIPAYYDINLLKNELKNGK